MKWRSAFSVLLVVQVHGAFATRSARADDDQDKTIAKDLFDRGVKKMDEGKCDEAPIGSVPLCTEAREAFKRANELAPGSLGVLRNLAYVEKGLGLVASAARNFREVARLAPLDPKPARKAWAEFAKKELESLEDRVPRVVVSVPAGEKRPGMKVTIDGGTISEAAWGTTLDLDPGDHTFRAEAPGYLPFERVMTIVEKDNAIVLIKLAPDPAATHPPPPVEKPAVDIKPAPISASASNARVIPLLVAGAGLAVTAVGFGFGYSALSKRNGSCDADRACEPGSLSSAKSLARTSTILTGVGATVLVGGLVWYLAWPSERATTGAASAPLRVLTPWVAVDGAGLAAVGSF